MKKKIIAIVLSLVLSIGAISIFTGCAGSDITRIRIYVPAGLPILAASPLFYNETQIEVDGVQIETLYTITTGATVMGNLISASPDFALVPMNLAAQIFNSTGEYILAGVGIQGALSIVQRVEGDEIPIQSLDDLVGETIFAFQQGMSPGVVLEALIERAELDINIIDPGGTPNPNAVNIVYFPTPDMVQLALNDDIAAVTNARFGLLAEPISTALSLGPQFAVAMDLAEAWYAEFEFRFPQVALVVRSSIAASHPNIVNAVIDAFEGAINFVRQNAVEAARMVGREGLNVAGLPPAAAPIIAFINGRGQQALNFSRLPAAREAVNSFLQRLTLDDVGGSVPGDEFYFAG